MNNHLTIPEVLRQRTYQPRHLLPHGPWMVLFASGPRESEARAGPAVRDQLHSERKLLS